MPNVELRAIDIHRFPASDGATVEGKNFEGRLSSKFIHSPVRFMNGAWYVLDVISPTRFSDHGEVNQ